MIEASGLFSIWLALVICADLLAEVSAVIEYFTCITEGNRELILITTPINKAQITALRININDLWEKGWMYLYLYHSFASAKYSPDLM